ncbi:DUF1302 family protein [Agaribacterium sp. ZY112]|uniref:DUF1302 family protein n=1 Tax=Agaribacterium sp. ZY112 TaxID=3233574 RepID=UPI003525F023
MPQARNLKDYLYILIAFALFPSKQVASKELETATHLSYRAAINTAHGQSGPQLSQLQLTQELGSQPLKNMKFFTSLRLRHNGIEGIGLNYADKNAYSDISRPWGKNNYEAELRELYIEYGLGKHYVTIGKQQVVWGKSDGLKLLDIINPQRFSEFILEDFDESRIPTWTLNYEYQFNNNQLQLLWIPDTSVHSLPKIGAENKARYEITAPRYYPQLEAFLQAHPNSELILKKTQYPDSATSDSDFALKWSSFIASWDLSLNYINQINDLPAFYSHIIKKENIYHIDVQAKYSRSEVIGASASTAIKDLSIRTEIAYTKNQHYQARVTESNTGVSHNDETAYVIGLDWFGFKDSLISAQLFQKHIHNFDSSIAQAQTDKNYSLLLRRSWLNEVLSAEILFLHNDTDQDRLIRPRMDYSVNDQLKLWLAADYFYGPAEGVYGQYDQNDRILTGAELSF